MVVTMEKTKVTHRSIVIKIGIKIVKSMDFAILISLKDLDFE
jgi:hypothetical protein